jgi:hypothetical protein
MGDFSVEVVSCPIEIPTLKTTSTPSHTGKLRRNARPQDREMILRKSGSFMISFILENYTDKRETR